MPGAGAGTGWGWAARVFDRVSAAWTSDQWETTHNQAITEQGWGREVGGARKEERLGGRGHGSETSSRDKQEKGILGRRICICEGLAGAVVFLAHRQGTGGWDMDLNPDSG